MTLEAGVPLVWRGKSSSTAQRETFQLFKVKGSYVYLCILRPRWNQLNSCPRFHRCENSLRNSSEKTNTLAAKLHQRAVLDKWQKAYMQWEVYYYYEYTTTTLLLWNWIFLLFLSSYRMWQLLQDLLICLPPHPQKYIWGGCTCVHYMTSMSIWVFLPRAEFVFNTVSFQEADFRQCFTSPP